MELTVKREQSDSAVKAAIKAVASGVDEKDIQGHKLLERDLGLDSLDVADVTMKIEERIGMTLDGLEDDLAEKKNTASVVDLQEAVWKAMQRKITLPR